MQHMNDMRNRMASVFLIKIWYAWNLLDLVFLDLVFPEFPVLEFLDPVIWHPFNTTVMLLTKQVQIPQSKAGTINRITD